MPTLVKSRKVAESRVLDSKPVQVKTSSGRTLALVGVFLAIALMLALPIRTWLAQRTILNELSVDIHAAQQRVDDLQGQGTRWKDPDFIRDQARLRFNFVRPGEIGLMTIPQDPEQQESKVDDLPDTWWGQLWGSVEEKSGRRPVKIEPDGSQVRPDAPR